MKKEEISKVQEAISSFQAYLLEGAASAAEEACSNLNDQLQTIIETSGKDRSTADKELNRKHVVMTLASLQKEREDSIASHEEAEEDANVSRLEICRAEEELGEMLEEYCKERATAETIKTRIQDKISELQLIKDCLARYPYSEV